MKKKLVAGLLTGAMIAALLTGCAGSGSDKSSDAKESYTIGIEQFAEHGSLDNCREGFLQGLEEEGIKEGDNLKVETKNAAADMGTAGQISDCLCLWKHLTDHLNLLFYRKFIRCSCHLSCRGPIF